MNYLSLYEKLIENARSKIRVNSYDVTYHNHHIFPLCWCKENEYLKYLIRDKRNLVLLTPREHFVAHHLLSKSFGGKMWFASWRMCHSCHTDNNYNGLITARTYERINQEQIRVNSEKIVTNKTKNKQSNSVRKWWKNMDEDIKHLRNSKISNSRIKMLANRDEKTWKEINAKIQKTLQQNPRWRKTCLINKIEYFSLSEASRTLSIHVDTIRNRIKSKNYPNYIEGILYES